MRTEKFYAKFKETENLDQKTLNEIEEFAYGLEIDEIWDYLGGKDNFSEYEMGWIEKSHKRGRAMAKKAAVDHLFASMKDRNGQNASIPYLRRFADKFEGDDNVQEGDVLLFRASVK